MKNIFKVILPVMAFTLASAAAVGSHDSKVEATKNPASIIGFVHNPNSFNCLQVEVDDCSTINSEEACMTSDASPKQVWLKDEGNACNVTLYRAQQ
jgi:hypothetical protein